MTQFALEGNYTSSDLSLQLDLNISQKSFFFKYNNYWQIHSLFIDQLHQNCASAPPTAPRVSLQLCFQGLANTSRGLIPHPGDGANLSGETAD